MKNIEPCHYVKSVSSAKKSNYLNYIFYVSRRKKIYGIHPHTNYKVHHFDKQYAVIKRKGLLHVT